MAVPVTASSTFWTPTAMPMATARNRNTVSRLSLIGVRKRMRASAPNNPNARARLSPMASMTMVTMRLSITRDWTKLRE